MKKILITGATGFIGQELCKKLKDAGHQLVALSRRPETASELLPLNTEVFLWEKHNELPPLEAFKGVDVVINLSGETVTGRWSKGRRALIHDTRETGTKNLVEAIKTSGANPELFLSGSAIGYYGDRGDEELHEDSGAGDDFLANVCTSWEAAADAAKSDTTRVLKMRIGVVLGPGGGAIAAMKKFFSFFIGGPVGSGKQWWSWIHRDDLINLIVHCVDNKVEGVVNATAPNPVRQKDFAKAMGEAMKRPSFMPAPAFAIKAALGGFSVELLSSKQVLPKKALDLGFHFQYPEVGPALKEVLGDD